MLPNLTAIAIAVIVIVITIIIAILIATALIFKKFGIAIATLLRFNNIFDPPVIPSSTVR